MDGSGVAGFNINSPVVTMVLELSHFLIHTVETLPCVRHHRCSGDTVVSKNMNYLCPVELRAVKEEKINQVVIQSNATFAV